MPCSDQHFIPILDEIHAHADREEGASAKRQHGGRRRGAGAPKGNLNGLRHGRNSRIFKEVTDAFLNTSEMHDLLIRLANRSRKRREERERGATELTAEILRRVGEIALDPRSNQDQSNHEFLRIIRAAERTLTKKMETQSR